MPESLKPPQENVAYITMGVADTESQINIFGDSEEEVMISMAQEKL